MIRLYNWKSIGLGYLKAERFSFGDSYPSLFCLENQYLFCRRLSSEASANQQENNFTVNYLINSCGLSSEGAISASKWFKLRSAEKADSVLALLRNHGFSDAQISKLVRSTPRVVNAEAEKTLLPKLEVFRSLGVVKEDVAKAMILAPNLFVASVGNRIIPTLNFLRRNLLSEKQVVSAFKRCPRFFHENLYKNVVPNIELLKELGMPQSCISLFLAHFPHPLLLDQEKFGELVRDVKEIGFNFHNSMSAVAIGTLGTKNGKLIMNRSRQVYMMRWGWSEDDVRYAVKRFPQCMFKSEKKIMQVMEFLVNKMGWSSGMIVKFPQIIGFSLEKRIIPRCSVVKVLLLKGLIQEKFSWSTVFCYADKLFVSRFVIRYLDKVPELRNVYEGKVDILDA
ncbi:hypothetical protein M0R45_036598 [Rubus argutus]|uniref:Transcription termination factor MTERF6, chloroplastic/mitochondrial-like n=1 Tax=Rubus argutus TaxID=59490 RepID=A0AAW1VZA3_RUBAR